MAAESKALKILIDFIVKSTGAPMVKKELDSMGKQVANLAKQYGVSGTQMKAQIQKVGQHYNVVASNAAKFNLVASDSTPAMALKQLSSQLGKLNMQLVPLGTNVAVMDKFSAKIYSTDMAMRLLSQGAVTAQKVMAGLAPPQVSAGMDMLNQVVRKTNLSLQVVVSTLQQLGITIKATTTGGTAWFNKMNQEIRNTGQVISQVKAKTHKFKMEWLGIMFGMMAVNRVLMKFLRSSVATYEKVTEKQGEFTKLTNKLSAAWQFFKFRLIDALGQDPMFKKFIDKLAWILDYLSRMDTENLATLAKYLFAIAGITGLAMIAAQMALLLDSIKMLTAGKILAGLTNFTTKLGILRGALAALIGLWLIDLVWKMEVGEIPKTWGNLIKGLFGAAAFGWFIGGPPGALAAGIIYISFQILSPIMKRFQKAWKGMQEVGKNFPVGRRPLVDLKSQIRETGTFLRLFTGDSKNAADEMAYLGREFDASQPAFKNFKSSWDTINSTMSDTSRTVTLVNDQGETLVAWVDQVAGVLEKYPEWKVADDIVTAGDAAGTTAKSVDDLATALNAVDASGMITQTKGAKDESAEFSTELTGASLVPDLQLLNIELKLAAEYFLLCSQRTSSLNTQIAILSTNIQTITTTTENLSATAGEIDIFSNTMQDASSTISQALIGRTGLIEALNLAALAIAEFGGMTNSMIVYVLNYRDIIKTIGSTTLPIFTESLAASTSGLDEEALAFINATTQAEKYVKALEKVRIERARSSISNATSIKTEVQRRGTGYGGPR